METAIHSPVTDRYSRSYYGGGGGAGVGVASSLSVLPGRLGRRFLGLSALTLGVETGDAFGVAANGGAVGGIVVGRGGIRRGTFGGAAGVAAASEGGGVVAGVGNTVRAGGVRRFTGVGTGLVAGAVAAVSAGGGVLDGVVRTGGVTRLTGGTGTDGD